MGAPFSGGEVQGPAIQDMSEKVSWVEKFVRVGAATNQAARNEHDRRDSCLCAALTGCISRSLTTVMTYTQTSKMACSCMRQLILTVVKVLQCFVVCCSTLLAFVTELNLRTAIHCARMKSMALARVIQDGTRRRRAQEEMAPLTLSATSGRRTSSVGELDLSSPVSRSVAYDATPSRLL